ncbi:MAG: hypothetical protein SFU99_00625, partial [Saprospiraceae bacterium]|nr:hypothetical protein [Saprospiraceae bacterium]
LYNVNSMFGKGLVKAHLKANAQEWAGTVLEESFINEIKKRGYNPDEFLLPYAKKYKVPYKKEESLSEEYVLRLVKGTLNEEALKNYANGVRKNFEAHEKTINDLRVKSKLDNTIKFLESFYAKK